MKNSLTTLIAVVLVVVAQSAVAQTTSEIPLRGKPIAEQPTTPKPAAEQTAAASPTSILTPLTRVKQTTTPFEVLKNAKTIYVRSQSLLVGQAVIESKLRKRQEFQQLGLVITRDPSAADLILEVKHDLFTKYVFTAIDPWTNIVVASGKLSSLGGTVAGKVAKRFMQQVMKARAGSL